MRARAGDPPRTMPQKILAGRAADPQLRGDLVQVKVDQVILSRAPARAMLRAIGGTTGTDHERSRGALSAVLPFKVKVTSAAVVREGGTQVKL